MKEFNSYLRYTLPGMVFLVAMIIPLVIVDGSIIIDFCKASSQQNIATLVSIIASSGVFGFLSSAIYWLLTLFFDHLKVRQTLLQLDQYIEVVDQNKKPQNQLSLYDVYTVFNAFWYQNNHSNKILEDKAGRLGDMTSSLGTAFVSLLSSIIIWLFVANCNDIKFQCQCSHLFLLLFWLFFLIVIGFNYFKTLKRFYQFNNSIFAERIIKKYEEKGNTKVQIFLLR